MIDYKKLLVLPCDKGLLIDVAIQNLSYYADIYIDKISIDTQNTFIPGKVSGTPIYEYTVTGNLKEVEITVDPCEFTELQGVGTLFFIYVTVKGTFSKDTPCGMDKTISVKALIDTYPIYRWGLKYIKQAYDKCSVPRDFIDFILRLKAFTMCLETEDYPLAINYWKKFFKNLKKPSLNCNCYGRDTV